MFLVLYVVSTMVDLVAEPVRQIMPWLHFRSQPLFMPALRLYLRAAWQGRLTERPGVMMQLALVFSCFGDVFLMYEGKGFFVLGLGSFLVAQLIYALVFARDGQGSVLKKPIYLLPFFVYALAFLLLIWQGLGEMKLPVLVYAMAICSMGLMALNRYKCVPPTSFRLVLLGAILFIISDSLIAIHTFYQPVPFSRFLIMGTYISAQFLIVHGYVKND